MITIEFTKDFRGVKKGHRTRIREEHAQEFFKRGVAFDIAKKKNEKAIIETKEEKSVVKSKAKDMTGKNFDL